MSYREAACAGVALLLSLLSVGGLLKASAQAWRGDGLRPVMTVNLLDDDAQQDSVAEQVRQSMSEALQPPDSNTDVNGESIKTSRYDGLVDMPASIDAGYLTIDQLDQRPLLLQDIDPQLDIDRADIDSGGSSISREPIAVRGILLINEHGGVDRLLLDDGSVPDELQRSLMQRFAQARFLPGMREGRAVRSALRIELSIH